MKLLIASDIHGSAEHCEQLFSAWEREKPDKILLLGDCLYHGPRNHLPEDYDTKRTMEVLNSLKSHIISVRGNCDSEVDQMVLEFPLLADYAVVEVAGRLMYATHGHKFTPQNLPLQPGDIFIQGHTHVPCCKKYGEILWLNPGSVAIPKENSHHQYIIYDKGEFIWKDFAGSVLQTYSLEN